jgi:hypothetical protein
VLRRLGAYGKLGDAYVLRGALPVGEELRRQRPQRRGIEVPHHGEQAVTRAVERLVKMSSSRFTARSSSMSSSKVPM